jgi:cytochrome P450 PksS
MTTLPLGQQALIPAPVDITTRAWKRDPFPHYARLRVEQPVCRVKLGRMDAWLVTRYDDVLTVLKDDKRFIKNRRLVQSPEQAAKRGWMPAFLRPLENNLLDLDEPDHMRLRGLVHKAFTPQRIEQMQARIEDIGNQLLLDLQRKAHAKGTIDLVHDFALPLPLTVIVELLGIPTEERDRFNYWTKRMIATPTTLNKFAMLPAIWSFMRYLRQTFDKRRADPRDDLLTALLQAEEAGDKLNPDELLSMVFVLLVAGHETTANLIASGTLALLQHPDQLALLRNDPTLIRSAVEELLRFANPVETATERYAREDMDFGGAAIQRGEMVLAALASANRDETVFANADELDITRAKNKHLAFGMGSHYCVGAPLARMEGAIAINLLVQELPNLRLAIPAEQLRWRSTQIVRGLEALPVKL